MTHGSLFSGIGGFDLAAEWMGWENVFHCEWNPFGQRVLKYYWPNAESFNDITKTDFTKYANTIDILTGGFPCQPYSSAGKRKGKEDERHLWPQMLRAIREIAPTWVVGENVYGLVNWSRGLVFHEVQSDLEAEGYEVFPFLLPAVSVNAPHRRDRIWFVAYSHNNRYTSRGKSSKIERDGSRNNGEQKEWGKSSEWINGLDGFQRDASDTKSKPSKWMRLEQHQFSHEEQRQFGRSGGKMGDGYVADTSSGGIQVHGGKGEGEQLQTAKFNENNSKQFKRMDWEKFPTQSPVCGGDDGISDRLDSITFPKWRNESIKAGGNAIVPQVVYQIFKTIEQYERVTNTRRDPCSPHQ